MRAALFFMRCPGSDAASLLPVDTKDKCRQEAMASVYYYDDDDEWWTDQWWTDPVEWSFAPVTCGDLKGYCKDGYESASLFGVLA